MLQQNFDIIAVSEAWLNNDSAQYYNLTDYNMYFINRSNKRGGGVAIYVRNTTSSNEIVSSSFSIDNISECVSIEIINSLLRDFRVYFIWRACLFQFLNYEKTDISISSPFKILSDTAVRWAS